jgi:hypothetical protein
MKSTSPGMEYVDLSEAYYSKLQPGRNPSDLPM